MRKISIIGNFDIKNNSYNGQTIKTRIVADELKSLYGASEIKRIDTAGGKSVVLRLLFQLFGCVMGSRNIIILPAQNGIKVILPLVVIYNLLFSRRIHYVVIGGWLAELLQRNRWLLPFAKRLHMIYPETQNMKTALAALGLHRVKVMPNCKPLHILSADELAGYNLRPMRFCIFSRITPTKGIEDAIKAVSLVNEKAGSTIATLDLYGNVDAADKAWFDALQAKLPSFVKYCGKVAFDKSVDTLKEYTALLFPTYYPGEGLAGTVIDAFAAGLPVVASDWHDNANIITDGKNGFVFSTRDVNRLAAIISDIYTRQEQLIPMKLRCIESAHAYLPPIVMRILAAELDICKTK